jgi:hypothetical protein
MTEYQKAILASVLAPLAVILFIWMVSGRVPDRARRGWRLCATGLLLGGFGFSVAALINKQLGSVLIICGVILNIIGMSVSK